MAKIKVHELAKELDKQSKDILSFLQGKGIEAKAAQSSVEEDVAQISQAVPEIVGYLREMSPLWKDKQNGKKPFIL